VPDHLAITRHTAIPLSEVELRTSRSSGPGGQHANVTASRVEAVFDVWASSALSDAQKRRIAERLGARVTATAQDHRSQARNRELALERLSAKLASGLVVRRPRRSTKPTAGSRERRLRAKQQQAQRKRGRRRPSPEE
jgi:ribosome-associated protein